MEEFLTPLVEVWEGLLSQTSPPSLHLLAGSFALSIFLVFTPRSWYISRNLITAVHEGGHALMAKLTFRKVSGIKLHSDTSGLTITKGKKYGLGAVLTLASGYTAPGLAGLLLSYLLSEGYLNLALFIVGVSILLLLVMIRNLWGLLILLPLTIGVYFLFCLSESLQVSILTFLTTFLVVGSLKPVFELYINRRMTDERDNDADLLRSITLLPYHFWILFFLLVTIVANFASVVILFSEYIPLDH